MRFHIESLAQASETGGALNHGIQPFVVVLGLVLGFGCATAIPGQPDAGKAPSGDAMVAGPADATQGIRPDASAVPDASNFDASPMCTVGPANLFGNPAFDVGKVPWVETSQAGLDLIVNQTAAPVSAHSVEFLVWLGGQGANTTNILHQDVVVPADATPVTISGMIWVATAETTTVNMYDKLELAVVNAGTDAVLEVVKSWSNLDKGTAWVAFSMPLSGSYAGQTIRLRWTSTLDITNNTNFFLDTLDLATTTCQ